MSSRRVLLVSTLLGLALACPVHAQKPSNLDFLESLSAQRNAQMRPRPNLPAPVPTVQDKDHPNKPLMGVHEYNPLAACLVFASPECSCDRANAINGCGVDWLGRWLC